MPPLASNPPSFSPRRRWHIGFDLALRTLLVCAVVVLVNYLGAQFSHRFYLSSQTRVALSARTLSVVRALTNHIAVTVYYSKDDDDFYPFYPQVIDLLKKYSAANHLISCRTVDYLRDSAEAQHIKEQYHLDMATDKSLIIFDAGGGRYKIASGDALTQFELAPLPKNPSQRQLEFEKKPVYFHGEQWFTSMLLALERTAPFKAYFLQGDGEPSLADTGSFGYSKFANALREDYVSVANLELLGDQPVPADCDLLIIAGPTDPFSDVELAKIDQYLAQGGRLLVLFNYASIGQPTGLEAILQRWGVNVGYDYVKDPDTQDGQDVIVRKYDKNNPVVASLAQHALQMILPRPVGQVNWQTPPANAPQVDELAFSSAASTLAHDPAEPPRSYPLIVAVEQKPGAGLASPHGNTRIIVAGDSYFLGNHYIEGGVAGVNRDFLTSAVNWLLDRSALLQGIGPRDVIEFRLLMTQSQRVELRWLLLAALPGAALLFGGLVWLVRRK